MIDQKLLSEESERRDQGELAVQHLKQIIPEWTKEFKKQSLSIQGMNGQVHVGDVFRLYPMFEFFRKKEIKIFVLSSSGLEKAFHDWSDVITVINANRPYQEILKDLLEANLDGFANWREFLGEWRNKLSNQFTEVAQAGRSRPLAVPQEYYSRLRSEYTEGGTKQALGIIWRTSMIGRDPLRNSSLEEFTPLISLPSQDWNILSLQYGDRSKIQEELSAFNESPVSRVIFDERIDPMKDYVLAGAQMLACDHIVSIDCSQVFQAGAHGVETSVLLSTSAPPEWGQHRICPNFPTTHRLYRQKQTGDWQGPIEASIRRIVNREPEHFEIAG